MCITYFQLCSDVITMLQLTHQAITTVPFDLYFHERKTLIKVDPQFTTYTRKQPINVLQCDKKVKDLLMYFLVTSNLRSSGSQKVLNRSSVAG